MSPSDGSATLKVVPDGVRMQLVIESKYDEIPKDGTKARVMFKCAVGEQFVDLLPTKRTGRTSRTATRSR